MYFSGFFSVTFDGQGKATVTTLENQEGTLNVITFDQDYTVAGSTGIVTFNDPGGGGDGTIKGAIGPNAMSFILTAEPQVLGQPSAQRFLWLGLKQN